MSTLPVTVKQDDATVQVPTTFPPQGVTLEHAPLPEFPPVPVAVALPELPPVAVAVALPELPPVADPLSEWMVHAPGSMPNASTIATRTDAIFIERFLPEGSS
jgi:hypothetical protein